MTSLPLCALLASHLFAAGNIQDQFIKAAGAGDLKAMQELIEVGARVNSGVNGARWTAACAAARAGKLDALKFLYEQRADIQVDCGSYEARNLLMASIGPGKAEQLRWLLTTARWTPEELSNLWENADVDAESLQVLLDRGFTVTEAQRGSTALERAVARGKVDTARLLLSKGADANVKTRDSGTILIRAVSEKNYDMVDLLLSVGHAEVNAAVDGYGTALHSASRGDDVKMVQKLLDAGANVNAVDPKSGNTALMYARSEGLAELLLRSGADPNAVTLAGKTALMLLPGSDRPQRVDIAKRLLAAQADPNMRDLGPGFTALHFAAYHGDLEMASLLSWHVDSLDQPSLPVVDNMTNKQIVGGLQTPLMVASLYGKREVVSYLLMAGASTQAQDAVGFKVLDYAQRKDGVTVQGRKIDFYERNNEAVERLIKNPPRLPPKRAGALDPIRADELLKKVSLPW